MFLVLLIVFLALLFLSIYGRMLRGRFIFPPGPLPIPMVGNLLSLDHARPQKTMQQWSKTYGPVFTVWMADHPVVMVTDYELMKDAFIKHGDQLSGRPRIFAFDVFTGGNYGLALSSGELWKEQRRFSLQVLRNFGLGRNVMEEKILTEARKLSSFILNETKSKGRVVLDLSTPLQLCVGNVISSVLFGHAFERADKRFILLKKTLEEHFKLLTTPAVGLLNSYPWVRHIPLFGHFGMDGLREQERTLREFMTAVLEAHKEELKSQIGGDNEPTDFVAAYLKDLCPVSCGWTEACSTEQHTLLYSSTGQRMDWCPDVEVREATAEMERREDKGEDMSYFSEWQLLVIMSDLFTAGMETTVTTLRWAILAMIKYPNVQCKVFEEIDLAIGRNKPPSMSDRQVLPYVVATLSEVQRWGNIIPINLAHVNETDFQLGGYTIPKMTEVIPQISALAIDEKIFPSPEAFRPERFLEADGKTLSKVDQFAPFSMGKRQCLGEGLARAELFLIFVHLMQRFEFLVPPGAEEPTAEPALGLTSAPKPHEILVKLRQESAVAGDMKYQM